MSNRDRAEAPDLRLTTPRGLVEYALHLRMNGERAPGGDETWRAWEGAAERYLRNVAAGRESGGLDDVARAALARLVALKDGPRDEAYERDKSRAWDAARRAVAAAPPPPGVQVDRTALVTAARKAILEAHGPVPGHDCCTYAVMYAACAVDTVLAALVPLLGNRQVDRDALATRLREAFPAREFLWRDGDTFGRLTAETLADLLAKASTDG